MATPGTQTRPYDVIIVGGGPAGLSAALVLGRARRRVLVCDDGRPRNGASRAVHGFVTRDGVSPLALRRLAWRELRPYDVAIRAETVRSVTPRGRGFVVRVGRSALHARRVLIATGVRDVLPRVAGLTELYGKSVHHCPYCDGWEVRGRPLAAYGRGHAGAELALSLRTWSADVVLCTNGPARLSAPDRARLARASVPVRQRRIERLDGRGGRLRRIVFRDGTALERDALFFTGPHEQTAPLAQALGCLMSSKGQVMTDRLQHTTVRGIFSAGDATHDVHFVVVAAGEGAKAAVAINRQLQEEEWKRPAGARR